MRRFYRRRFKNAFFFKTFEPVFFVEKSETLNHFSQQICNLRKNAYNEYLEFFEGHGKKNKNVGQCYQLFYRTSEECLVEFKNNKYLYTEK